MSFKEEHHKIILSYITSLDAMEIIKVLLSAVYATIASTEERSEEVALKVDRIWEVMRDNILKYPVTNTHYSIAPLEKLAENLSDARSVASIINAGFSIARDNAIVIIKDGKTSLDWKRAEEALSHYTKSLFPDKEVTIN